MGASLPSGVWVGVGFSGTGEMVGVSVGAAVGFAVAVGAGVAVGVAVAVGVDVAIGSGVGPEQAARVAMSIRMIGVAWMIVRSTGGVPLSSWSPPSILPVSHHSPFDNSCSLPRCSAAAAGGTTHQ